MGALYSGFNKQNTLTVAMFVLSPLLLFFFWFFLFLGLFGIPCERYTLWRIKKVLGDKESYNVGLPM